MIAYEDRLPRNGRTAREIAERTGLSVRQVQNWTSERRTLFEERAKRRQEAIRAFKARHPEMTIRALAAEFECSVGTVHRALKAAKDAT